MTYILLHTILKNVAKSTSIALIRPTSLCNSLDALRLEKTRFTANREQNLDLNYQNRVQ